jgi:acetyl-CoA carboxylase biotin carboxyl carrier protein
MPLTEDEVVQILKLVEQSTFDELHLETGDLKLVVKKHADVASGERTAPEASPAPRRTAPEKETQKAQAAEPDKNQAAPAEAARREGLIPIKAPLLGTVYRRPAPESPSYVEKGSFVKEDDTVCLIEVMKVFTAVKAGVRGRIAEVLIETNAMVEYGQTLFLVKPGDEPA